MAQFRISGIWKNDEGIITHYAIHSDVDKGFADYAIAYTKKEAIEIVEKAGNFVKTWIWDYKDCTWIDGESVIVYKVNNEKHLRTEPDSKVTNNLGHLINYDWIYQNP